MPIPTTKSKFPSAITRDQASASAGIIRRGKTSSEVAMMTSGQYKAYAQGRGQWPDKQLEHMENPENRSGGN
jgi:hypothetical protein